MNEQTMPASAVPETCATCPAFNAGHLTRLGIDTGNVDHILALAGNPNTGKSTVFNALTGLRQHTGNWPGKTVTRAEGAFALADKRYRIVDLPGTYSLLSTSADEEVARDFILFGRPDVTIIVVDATRLERNLNLVLQVLEITDRAVLCVNLMDEARRHKLTIDDREYDTGLTKFGAILGDDAQTGCNSVLNPGCIVGPRTLIYANVSLRKGYYPADTIIKLEQGISMLPRM